MTNILGVVVFTGIISRHILKILFDFNRVIAGMVYPSNLVESSESQNIFDFYYRAMHFSAKRGIAIVCRLSVCLSVCNVGEL